MLVRNALLVKPNASLDEVRALMPALAAVPDGELADWIAQARRRMGPGALQGQRGKA